MSDNDLAGPEYTPHPFAEIFPPMSPDEREELEKSIKENGLREPIIVNTKNQILDGLNRWRACLAIGVEPIFEVRDLTDAEAVQFIKDRNWVRRNLEPSQWAAIGNELAQLNQGQSKAANLPVSQAEAAKIVNVSERSIRAARAIQKASPELHDAVKAGAISTHAAGRIARLPDPERSAKIVELKESIRAKGSKLTKTAQRSHGKGKKDPYPLANVSIAMVGKDPVTGKDNQSLHGAYNILLHVARAIPQFATELRKLPELTRAHLLPESQARELRRTFKHLRTVDFADLRDAIDLAVGELNSLIKSDTEDLTHAISKPDADITLLETATP